MTLHQVRLFFVSAALNLINCCSLINNYHILKFNSYPKNLACLNGIRVLSLGWILLGHTILFAVYYSGTCRHSIDLKIHDLIHF